MKRKWGRVMLSAFWLRRREVSARNLTGLLRALTHQVSAWTMAMVGLIPEEACQVWGGG